MNSVIVGNVDVYVCGCVRVQRPRLPARAAGRGDARRHALRVVERAHRGRLARALGRHAGLVRGRLPRQRQVRCHHVRALRPGDTAGDRSVPTLAFTLYTLLTLTPYTLLTLTPYTLLILTPIKLLTTTTIGTYSPHTIHTHSPDYTHSLSVHVSQP